MAGRTQHIHGFTLVEAVIVAAVIAVILAVTIPRMRERERQRLQVVADAQPGTVFAMECRPASDPLVSGEGLDIVCGIANTTPYDLVFSHHVRLIFSRVGGPAKAWSTFDPPTDPNGEPLIIKSKQALDIHFRSDRIMQPGEYPEALMTAISAPRLIGISKKMLHPGSVGNMGSLEHQPLKSDPFSFRVVAAPLEEPERQAP